VPSKLVLLRGYITRGEKADFMAWKGEEFTAKSAKDAKEVTPGEPSHKIWPETARTERNEQNSPLKTNNPLPGSLFARIIDH
jgi:hypothetical protein